MILNIYNFSDGNKVYFFDNKNEHVLVEPEVKFDNCNDYSKIDSDITEVRIKRLKMKYSEWFKTLKIDE